MDVIKAIEHEQLKSKVPVLDVGNTVKVHVKVKEGNRERIQVLWSRCWKNIPFTFT